MSPGIMCSLAPLKALNWDNISSFGKVYFRVEAEQHHYLLWQDTNITHQREGELRQDQPISSRLHGAASRGPARVALAPCANWLVSKQKLPFHCSMKVSGVQVLLPKELDSLEHMVPIFGVVVAALCGETRVVTK